MTNEAVFLQFKNTNLTKLILTRGCKLYSIVHCQKRLKIALEIYTKTVPTGIQNRKLQEKWQKNYGKLVNILFSSHQQKKGWSN